MSLEEKDSKDRRAPSYSNSEQSSSSPEADPESRLRLARFARALAPVHRDMSEASAAVFSPLGEVALWGDADRRSATSHPVDDRAERFLADAKEGKMLRNLCELGDFVRRLSVQARFGDLSRARLSLLRVQLCGEYAECDWIARPADPWDADLPTVVGRRNASTQALHDAITVRALLFRALPNLRKAELRAYRYLSKQALELIVSGSVNREVRAPAGVRSLPTRAKLFGFNFWLDEGILADLLHKDCAVNA